MKPARKKNGAVHDSSGKHATLLSLVKPSEGLNDLLRLIKVTKTDATILAGAHAHLEAIPESMVQRMIALGIQLLREHLEIPKVQNNLTHVEDQLLRPVIEDGDELAAWFGIDPLRLRLLVVLHDLGKVEIPQEMFTVLSAMFPGDFVAREILTHEYASMYWIEKLGRQLTLEEGEIVSLQQLIANHNFGPNLCLAKNRYLRDHWWPMNFREKVMPKLTELGVNLAELYQQSEEGQFQYPHAEDEVYAALLAAYDRAIANRYNEFGLETWQKFAQQDYSEWLKALESNPGLPTCFNAAGITDKMEQAAMWADEQIRAMWAILSEKHVLNARRSEFNLEKFGPYRRQVDGVQKLREAIGRIRDVNAQEKGGTLTYETSHGEKFRVEEAPPRAHDKSKLFWWDPVQAKWKLVAKDRSPIKLFFDLLKGDF